MRSIVHTCLVALLAISVAVSGDAKDGCRQDDFEGTPFSICEFSYSDNTIRLFLNDEAGRPFGSFAALSGTLAAQGHKLLMGMNGGMYHPDRSPVGLYIEDNVQKMRAIARAGPGNFGMLPNGVFCVAASRLYVIETRAYLQQDIPCQFATQSGPMLVIDGALHPRFLVGSSSKYLRNGVGVSQDGQTAYFVISDAPVNFHTFARLFRDHLGLYQALFLDGNTSKLYAPSIGRADFGRAMGPMIAVSRPLQ